MNKYTYTQMHLAPPPKLCLKLQVENKGQSMDSGGYWRMESEQKKLGEEEARSDAPRFPFASQAKTAGRRGGLFYFTDNTLPTLT